MRFSFPVGLATGIGLIFAVIAAIIGYVTPLDLLTQAARVEGLPLVTAASLEDRQVGEGVVIEGQVSDRNRALFREYVAYYRQEYRGDDDDGDPVWREDERAAPALRIDVADGGIQIANQGYDLKYPLTEWQEPGNLSWDLFARKGTKRYRGVQAGDTIFAVGSVVQGSEGLVLSAEFIAGGSRVAYVETQRQSAQMSRWVGLGLGAVSIISLVIGLVIAIRDR